MNSQQATKPKNIIESFKILKGNTRTSIMFEPMWGIPFVLYNFYLSLYMKELGITDRQIGYLISLGFITGTVFSVLAGAITDKLGRKRATFIFDLISWPGSVLIYLFSHSFWMFALATVVNSATRVVAVAWNMMIIEDADNDQRAAAFNLVNIINISTGVIIPAAGILVKAFGIVHSERIFLTFAAVSMTTMMILRNHKYHETKVGQQIIEERRKNNAKISFKNVIPLNAIKIFKDRPIAIVVVCIFVFFNIYIPLCTINSLYFAPYMTEVLGLSKSVISILGGIYSAVLFVVFVFINPVISAFNKVGNMLIGLVIQVISLFLLIVIPSGKLGIAIPCIAFLALGFGIFRPFLDSLLAEVTEGKERASVYSLVNAVTCVATALIGLASGSIYEYNPRLLFIISMGILVVCIVILALLLRKGEKAASDWDMDTKSHTHC